MSDAPETIWACESASGQCVVSFSTPSEDYRIEYRRADLLASTIGAKLMQERAADACEAVAAIIQIDADRFRGGSNPHHERLFKAAIYRDAATTIRAIPAPTDAEVLAAAMELPQIKALLVALEELRLEAWGYDHLFETPFHAHVHDTLQYELKKLVQP